VFQRLQASACRTLPVIQNRRLVGLLTAENLGEFLMIRSARNGRLAVESRTS
jgi:CBS-domain-containing membrane protein